MVTLNTIKDTSNTNALFLCGLSTDVKPIDEVDGITVVNGSEFVEIDTGKRYRFDASNSEWFQYGNGSTKTNSLHSKGKIHSIGKWGDEDAYEGSFEYDSTSNPWSGTNSFSLSAFIEGFTGADKIIDYSVCVKTNQGKFIKASMTGSGMDISAFLSNGNTLNIYSSETIVDLIFCIQYV